MNKQEAINYCLSFPRVTTDFPFDQTTQVFRIGNKIFSITDLNDEDVGSMNLKCEPERSVQLRERYESVKTGYHMNKKHWITVFIDLIDEKTLKELIYNSYILVKNSLPKSFHQPNEND